MSDLFQNSELKLLGFHAKAQIFCSYSPYTADPKRAFVRSLKNEWALSSGNTLLGGLFRNSVARLAGLAIAT